MIALVLAEPLIALAVVIVLLAIGIGLVIMMRKAIRRAMQKRRERKATANGDPSEPPDAADQTGPVRG